MKIGLVQLASYPNELTKNIGNHEYWIDHAIDYDADLLIFPELSLSGYAPKTVATHFIVENDPRLLPFRKLSRENDITISVGVPLKIDSDIYISQLIFSPREGIKKYYKHYLHPDECPYFKAGSSSQVVKIGLKKIAFAICYELFNESHFQNSLAHSPDLYIASVAKFANGIDAALIRAESMAKKAQLPILMVNAVGNAEGGVCAGTTTVWNEKGDILEQLNEGQEGLLIYDTEQNTTISTYGFTTQQ